ncbi:MAG: hypothetical protein K1X68_00825 [Saprospiraceae bacterium]|nr:hypothetical protein [Saprospiraceae bacterium]HMW39695.1 hypothetical protein [Saprospiraceae bacterium]HMX88838.1 hypothetical protein [Saprospiraceae bacterium]HMZ39298.1 hypothetical protein [Saprospiraceae bacterium]HNA65446.1 hypothetical protein [Saprospiraceae bacterium]
MPESNVSSNRGPVLSAFLLILITLLAMVYWRKPELPSNNTIEDSRATFAKLMNSSNYHSFGLENPDQINSLKAGSKFRKYFIELQRLKNYNGSDPIYALLNPHFSVEVPLLNASKKIITSMEFSKNSNDNWEAVGFGLSPSFRKLALSGIGNTSNNLILVELPALNMEFILFEDPVSKDTIRQLLYSWQSISAPGEGLPESPKIQSFESDSALLKYLQNIAINLKDNVPG